MGVITRYLGLAKRIRVRLWRSGRWWGAKINNLSGAIAGLLFILLIPLGLSLAQTNTYVSIPIIPAANKTTYALFVGGAVAFAFFAVLETLSGIFSWVLGLRLRIYNWGRSE